jgi:hypothetical protein
VKRTYCVGIAPADACGTGAADRWCEGNCRNRKPSCDDCESRLQRRLQRQSRERGDEGENCTPHTHRQTVRSSLEISGCLRVSTLKLDDLHARSQTV